MKTKAWIGIFALILAVSLGLSLWLLRPSEASAVQVYCDGNLLLTLDLRIDRQEIVETEFGRNVVTVQGGKVAVTEADCPDGYCMRRGWCSGGAQIVCLPNRLVLRFTGESEVDAVS